MFVSHRLLRTHLSTNLQSDSESEEDEETKTSLHFERENSWGDKIILRGDLNAIFLNPMIMRLRRATNEACDMSDNNSENCKSECDKIRSAPSTARSIAITLILLAALLTARF